MLIRLVDIRVALFCLFICGVLAVAQVPCYAQAPSDFETAYKAAVKGDAFAQLHLGVMCSLGQGVPQDYKQAVYWYTTAAEQGNAGAQVNLGSMYDFGRNRGQIFILDKTLYAINPDKTTNQVVTD